MAYRKKFNEGFRAGQFDAFWRREYNPNNDVPILRPVVNVEAYEEGYAAGFGSQTLTGEFSPVPFSWEYHHGQCQVEIGRGGAIKYRRRQKLRVKSLPVKDSHGVWILRAQHGILAKDWYQFSSKHNELKRLHLPEDCKPDIFTPDGTLWYYSDNDNTTVCPICHNAWYYLPGPERDAHLLKHLGIKNAHQS